ncbi:uncharacterized protein LOC126569735 [Anopheles aquasalis]|uniref:uncharacterized protein LOC126569735 n=1 Tax=Anopheles aquasalis TaxID=42839 RepID=UPI00215B2E4C|nr:uncharacterized protein LOC126569735 [Anopheles aquasalis]XP_050082982.1 uncharacterized protein LOC126569735 [Anopheles aquasalis]
MAANRKLFSSKEEIRKEDDDGGGGGGGASDTGGGGGKDEVDYVLTSANGSNGAATLKAEVESSVAASKMATPSETPALAPKMAGSNTLDKFNIFHLRRRPKSDPGTGPIGRHAASVAAATAGASPANGSAVAAAAAAGTTAAPAPEDGLKKKKSRFVKSASIARIFGNTYNTKKYDDSSALLKLQQFKRSFLSSEKFHKKEGGAGAGEETAAAANGSTTDLQIGDSCYVNDSESSAKAIKSITRGLGRLLRRNCHSIDISRPDPEYKVSYLGNVLTGWAKGDGCVEKPLATLWRNYTQNSKPDVMMKLCLCPSGLKATTRQHGLTEYWSHRITYCSSPKNYPRVFCWIYRHEGRKLKHEFRCHAVICSKENIAQEISSILKENLAKALREFKRDKLNRQNARLSLANSVYDNPSMPRRKIMLSVGANNYRPPLERSKSAPKLMAIEEMIGEEDEEEDGQGEDNHRGGAGTALRSKSTSSTGAGAGLVLEACCREDALFPSTTLGRRRCRRGHSIRRSRLRNSFKSPKDLEAKVPLKNENIVQASPMNKSVDSILDTIGQEAEEEEEEEEHDATDAGREQGQQTTPDADEGELMMVRGKSKRSHSSDSSEDDFEAFLAHYNYNSSEPLSTELISYFDMKLNPTAVCSMHDLTQRHHSELLGGLEPALEDTQRLALSLDDLDHYPLEGLAAQEEEDEVEKGPGGRPVLTGRHSADAAEEEVFFNQDEVLEMLRTAAESAAGSGNGMGHQYQYHHHHHHHHLHHRLSSDPRLSSCLHGDDDTAPPSLLCVTSKLNASVGGGGGGASGAGGDGVGGPHHHHHHHHHHQDSDEGSISSGCETSSTVTTNTDDSVATATAPSSSAAALAALSKPCSVLERVRSFEQLAENQVIHVPLGERQSSPAPGVGTPVGGGSGSTGTPQSPVADAMIFKRSITFPAPGIKSNFLMPMAGSGPVASEPIDSPLDSLVDNVVGGAGTGHHLHLQQYREEHQQQRTVGSVENSKPKVRHVRLKATAVAAAVNTELINQLQAIDSDSEFSDESGYVEFQDNQPSIKSVTA